MFEEEQQVRMDQRVRRGVLKAERVPSQSASVVQDTARYSTSSILRGYRKGDQLGSTTRAGLGAEADILC